jgi:hypothetical protein
MAGVGFGVRIVLVRFLFDEAYRPSRFSPEAQAQSLETAPPGFILETHHPLRMVLGEAYQPLESPFFLSYSESGLSSQIVETVYEKLHATFGLRAERPHELQGLRARLAARIALHNFCVWLNDQLGRPRLAFADLLGW